MNVLILISSIGYGGAEKQAILDANLLAKEHNVYLAYFFEGGLKELISPEVTLINIKKTGYIHSIFKLMHFIKKNKIQIIHASLFFAIFIASIANSFKQTKVIWHIHSHEYGLPFRSRISYQLLARKRSVKKILFVNHELLEHYKPFKFPAHKIDILYNHSEILIDGDMQANPLKTKNIYIGYIGRIIKLKRVEYLLDLAEFLMQRGCMDFIIHVVGDGSELEIIKETAKKKKLFNNIIFHGFQTDVNSYYKTFDFFVNPSSEECLSIAMIDAGMIGLPIVAFNVGGNSEIVIDGNTGYIVNSQNDFNKKCLMLIENRELRLNLGSSAQIHCEKLFSKDNHYAELVKIYHDIDLIS